jgi:uncharacterized CHY-type Zn-finger protein
VTREIFGIVITGVGIDLETRCAHYHSEQDIVAIKFECCGEWYCCHQCHVELAGHEAEVWPREKFDNAAILCGACGQQLTIREYLACKSACPRCGRQFNPDCAKHRHFYFV